MSSGYYEQPHGIERALRSRIRRAFEAVEEIRRHAEFLSEHAPRGELDVTPFEAGQQPNGPDALYDLMVGYPPNCEGYVSEEEEESLKRAQARLLSVPVLADDAQGYADRVIRTTNEVIRNVGYHYDAGGFADENRYELIRERAVATLGLAYVVKAALDTGFIRDARSYRDTGI